MGSVNTVTLGCKVNFADSQAVAALLPESSEMAVGIVATCCVTSEGEKQSRKEVRRAVRKVGSNGSVFVTGCAARLKPEEFAGLGGNVIVVTGEPDEIATAIAERMPAFGREEPRPRPQGSRTRFFLKVQDGCGNRCAYCVVPLVRGEPRSIRLEQLLMRAGAEVRRGTLEIVVSGINVGAYRDGEERLSGLIRGLTGIEGIARLRLSSIEALDVTPDLLAVMAGNNHVAKHLHIPLQSGDNRVLAAMKRRYNSETFLERIEAVRAAIPDINLTTDVMAGFPGEDDDAFNRTLDLVEEAGFTRLHVFPFSARPGTSAALLEETVSPGEKKARAAELRKLSRRLCREHRRRKLGRVSEVLLESIDREGYTQGYSSDYTRFAVAGAQPGRAERVVAEELMDDCVLGKVAADE